jgi:hypothetical protein
VTGGLTVLAGHRYAAVRSVRSGGEDGGL